MAIITEYFTTREDGVVLNRTYSDQNMMIERDGIRYSEAIDPAELNRQYTETDEPVDGFGAVSEADYQNALREMGVNV
jgi:hypothetical protein